MATRGLVIAGVVLAVVAAVVLGQAGGTGQGAGRPQWEYGVLLGEPQWSWYAPGTSLGNLSGSDFAAKIGTRYSDRGVELEANVLNALSVQGWELVTVAEKSKYILRRARGL